MTHYTVLIPQRNATGPVRNLLPSLGRVLDSLILPYELICIDDASDTANAAALKGLLSEVPALRVLRFDQPRGTSAALTAGIFAARGDLIIAMDPNGPFSAQTIPHLIARLSQHDLVVAERARSLASRVQCHLSSIRRVITAEPQLHQGEELFWAATREVVSGLALAPGLFRLLPSLLAARGLRVCRLELSERLPPQGSQYRPNVGELMAIRWLHRRFEPHLARELAESGSNRPLRIARTDVGPSRSAPAATFVPLDKEHRDSA